MKFNCIIDTSSYLNLNLCEFSQGTVFMFLSDIVKIQFSPEVHHEINEHQNDTIPQTKVKYKERIPDVLKRSSQIYRTRKFTFPDYERRLWGEERSREAGNKGEKQNLMVTIDLFLYQKTKELIYIIDDENAKRGCLNGVFDAFPVFQVWSSFDVVLYLYLDHKSFTKEMAQNAIRDIYAKTATNDDQMDPKKTQKRVRELSKYLRYIEKISVVKNR